MKYAYFKSALAICFFLFIISGCEEEPTAPPDLPAPELTSVEPVSGFAGETATITGSGFSTDAEKNLITFGYHDAFGYKSIRPDDATATSLTFTRPRISAVDADLPTNFTVLRVDDPDQTRSETLSIIFKPLISTFADGLANTRGIAFDGAGNAYVSDADADMVYKITQEGEQSVYAEVGGHGGMVFDSNGYLYIAAKKDNTIFRIAPGGGDFEVFIDDIVGPNSLAFDTNGNLYIGCADNVDHPVWRITSGDERTEIDIAGGDNPWFFSLTICDDNLYWYDRDIASLKRAPLTADGIGTVELLWESDNPDYFATGLSVDSEGAVYLGGGWDQFTLDRINADGSFEQVETLPTDNFKFSAFWGQDLYLTTQHEGLIYKVYVGVEGGAP